MKVKMTDADNKVREILQNKIKSEDYRYLPAVYATNGNEYYMKEYINFHMYIEEKCLTQEVEIFEKKLEDIVVDFIKEAGINYPKNTFAISYKFDIQSSKKYLTLFYIPL